MIRLYVAFAATGLLFTAAVCGPADASRTTDQQQADGTPAAAPTSTPPTAAVQTSTAPTAPVPSTPTAASATLPGLTGSLTYDTASEDVTVQFPGATEIERHA